MNGTDKGPASYFPSIERTYGRPIAEWVEIVNGNTELTRHGQLVAWLKREYGVGHGHATALVAYALQQRRS